MSTALFEKITLTFFALLQIIIIPSQSLVRVTISFMMLLLRRVIFIVLRFISS